MKNARMPASPHAAMTVLKIAIASIGLAAPLAAPAAGAAEAAEGRLYLELEELLDRVRGEYLPFLIYYPGGDDQKKEPGDLPSTWEARIAERSFRRVLERLPVGLLQDSDLDARIPPGDAPGTKRGAPGAKKEASGKKPEPDRKAGKEKGKEKGREKGKEKEAPPERKDGEPDPAPPGRAGGAEKGKTAAEIFGLVQGVPTLVLADFRERVVKRYTDKLPSSTVLRREIELLVARNLLAARTARVVEEQLERSRYAHAAGDTRTAVQIVLPYDDPKGKERQALDPVLLEEMNRVIEGYRAEAKKLLEKGFEEDRQKKYAEALKTLEGVVRNYPFPDVIRAANQKSGEILRKAQLGI